MQAQPQRLRGQARARPTRKNPLHIFFEIPPAVFFGNGKGCFLVVRLLQAVEALGLRLGGRAAALRALNLKAKRYIYNRYG